MRELRLSVGNYKAFAVSVQSSEVVIIDDLASLPRTSCTIGSSIEDIEYVQQALTSGLLAPRHLLIGYICAYEMMEVFNTPKVIVNDDRSRLSRAALIVMFKSEGSTLMKTLTSETWDYRDSEVEAKLLTERIRDIVGIFC
ncbi:hypothetical protein BDR07DRAFT_1459657 [Suillus spraguei]|nr:hypothetical protein BDR07DRAFT_1459657 [Suillus spraguei]